MLIKSAVTVAVENTAYHFDIGYTYLLPAQLSEKAVPGCRVMVPFGAGNKARQGLIIGRTEVETAKGLKYVAKIIDDVPLINEEMLSLVRWLKDRTFCTLFEAFKAVVPVGITHRTVVTYTAVPDTDISSMSDDEKQIYLFLQKSNEYKEGTKIL